MRKHKNSSSLAKLFLMFYFLYLLIPIIQYFVLNIGDPFDPFFTNQRFREYAWEFILFIVTFFVAHKLYSKSASVDWRFSIGNRLLLAQMFFGSALLIFQFYYTDSYRFVSIDRSLSLTKFHTLPELYSYLFMPSYVLLLYRLGEMKLKQKMIFYFTSFVYFIIWYKLGSRGELLIPLIFWIAADDKKFLSGRNVLISIPLIVLIFYSSISSRWKTSGASEVINIVKEHPEALSLADLEFAWGLRNFNKLKGVGFTFDYWLESHIEGLLKGPAGLLGISLDDPPNRYRYKHNAERVANGASYGGTGFSLFFEAKEAFGPFSIVQYIILWTVLIGISLNIRNSNFVQVYAALLLPNLLLVIRAGLPIGMILTKALYTLILILFMLIVQKVIKSSKVYV